MPSDPTPNPNSPPSGKPRRRPAPGMGGNLIWVIVLALLVGWFLFSSGVGNGGTIEWGEFWTLLQKGKLKKVIIVGDHINGEVVDNIDDLPDSVKTKLRKKMFTVQQLRLEDNGALDAELRKQIQQTGLKVDRQEDHFSGVLSTVMAFILPAVILLALFLFLLPRFRDPLGGGFLSNYIKSPAKRYERSKLRVTFEDVAGMQNAKSELQEVVEFLRTPEKFQRLGAVVPKGVLLVGPPGTGKTLLARAVAGEAGVPFYSISGSEFIQMFVGVGASRVRDMFKTAKENSPAILFIDEIDAVGRMRGAGVGGGSDEREQTLNQILSEMDGFTPTETVIVMAATNRPDVLDSALLRPGRFDRHITIDRPTWQGRLAILKVHVRNKPLADDLNLEAIARGMIGMTGADLRNLANEAALLATRENKNKIDRRDFERAADRVLIGAKREEVLSPEEKRRTAYHEAGHAVVTWLVPEGEKPMKVSIVPRGRTGGVNLIAPDEDRYHHGLDYFKAKLVMMMGGRAIERLIYGQPYAGVEMDLKQATKLARYMVTHWGMSERLGPMSFRMGEEHVFLGKEIQESRDFSESTAAVIDDEVQKLLRAADEHAFELLQANRDKVERIVDALMQREELLREEIEVIINDTANNGIVTHPAAST
ncbi:MAG TPA: ATP-dependent zinc metalloprotease FtsH [Gemmataceae bacterium]|nr:ATP-dependent zinc metalloprotease FtsH [Gemmataceae bacterium]